MQAHAAMCMLTLLSLAVIRMQGQENLFNREPCMMTAGGGYGLSPTRQ